MVDSSLTISSAGFPSASQPLPGYAEPAVPTDSASGSDVAGPSAADSVNLATGEERNDPGPDISARNPTGPDAVYSRSYGTYNANQLYGSPGLSPGWVDNYDFEIAAPTNPSGWYFDLTLYYPNGASEFVASSVVGGNVTLSAPIGAPYYITGNASATIGQWNDITIHFKDLSTWTFKSSTGTPNIYRLSGITNLVGNGIVINRDSSQRLSSITNDASLPLLNFTYPGTTLGSVTDATVTGRSVNYTFSNFTGLTNTQLATVSNIGDPQVKESTYSYSALTGIPEVPFLSGVTAPNPSGSGPAVSDTINYDTNGRVTQYTDAKGNIRKYTYGGGISTVAVGSIVSNVFQADLTWTQKWSPLKVDTGVVEANAATSTIGYGDINNPFAGNNAVNNNGQASSSILDSVANVTKVTIPANDTTIDTNITYDNTISTILKLPSQVQVGTKTPTKFAYYNGEIVGGVVQKPGLLKSVSTPTPGTSGANSWVTTTYTYSALGNVLTVVTPGPSGSNVTYTFGYGSPEVLGEPVSITDPLTHSTNFQYDTMGNVSRVTDAIGNFTDFVYNNAHQVTTVTYPKTNQTGAGHAQTITAYSRVGGDVTTVTMYDENGVQVRQITNGVNSEDDAASVTGSVPTISQIVDSVYRNKTIKDGNLNTTTHAYDTANKLNNLTKRTYPGNTGGVADTMAFAYDKDHNLTNLTDGLNRTINYSIANLPAGDGRLKGKTYPAGTLAGVTYLYDSYDRVTSVQDGVSTIGYTYDDNDLVMSVTTTYVGLPPATISYVYNQDGSRQKMITPAGTFRYFHDSAGRITTTTYPWFESTTYTYLNNNWLSQEDNGLVETIYFYNARGFLTEKLNQSNAWVDLANNPLLLSDFGPSMQYDAVGNRTQEHVNVPRQYSASGGLSAAGYSGNIFYQYDSKDHLILENASGLVQDSGSGNNHFVAIPYSYGYGTDAADNLTILGSATYTPNADNQLTGPTYDGDGSPTTYPIKGTNRTLAYDAEDRLTSITGLPSEAHSPRATEMTA